MLTKAELLIAAAAAERWPVGVPGIAWGYTKNGKPSTSPRVPKGYG